MKPNSNIRVICKSSSSFTYSSKNTLPTPTPNKKKKEKKTLKGKEKLKDGGWLLIILTCIFSL